MRIAAFLAVVSLCGSALAQDKAPLGSAPAAKDIPQLRNF